MKKKLANETTVVENAEAPKSSFFNKVKRSEAVIGYLFMLPTIIGFSIFVAYPLLSSIYYAFTDWGVTSAPKWVGLDNFKFLFLKDPTFIPAIKATILYVLWTVPASIVAGLLLAALLNRPIPGIRFFRTVFYLPVVLPAVASLVLWKFIFAPDYGLANQFLTAMGLPTSDWLQSERMVFPSLLIVCLWGVGSQMIIFLSGLQSVPSELFEAADIDGASGIQKFFSITVPMITPVIFLQLITGVIAGFQVYTPAMLLTGSASGAGGGPNLKTYFLNYAIYQSAFNQRQFGFAVAEVWVLFVIVMLFTILIFKSSNSFVYYEEEDR